MVPVKEESNIEVLRLYVFSLEDQVKRLARENAELKNQQELAKQDWLEASLRDTLSRLQKKFYGFGREELVQDKPRKSGHCGYQLNLHAQHRVSEEAEESIEKKPRKPSNSNQTPIERVHLFRDEQLCEESKIRGVTMGKAAWKEVSNLYQESTEITVIERTYQKIIHKQAKYRLRDEFNTTGKEVIITAPGPVKVRPNSRYSIDFAIAVVTDKYEMHLPLERQRRKMEGAGLDVDVKTLYGLCEAVAEHGQSITENIKHDILEDFPAPHMDETPWKILADKKQGYLWVLSNRTGCYYQFEPTRSGKIPEEILKDYEGAVITDAYSGYNRIGKNKKIRIQNCWAHARREFYERYDDYPTEAGEVIHLMDQLFQIEAKAKTPGELRDLRKTESKKVTDLILQWMYKTKPRFLKTEGISKAIQYCLNNWQGLTHFLTDLTVEIQNNDAERALRHAVVGRKNFAGSRTINGADTAATLYTIIETCKRNSLQPSRYLEYLITERWHGRQALTPFKYAVSLFGLPEAVIWPERKDWQI